MPPGQSTDGTPVSVSEVSLGFGAVSEAVSVRDYAVDPDQRARSINAGGFIFKRAPRRLFPFRALNPQLRSASACRRATPPQPVRPDSCRPEERGLSRAPGWRKGLPRGLPAVCSTAGEICRNRPSRTSTEKKMSSRLSNRVCNRFAVISRRNCEARNSSDRLMSSVFVRISSSRINCSSALRCSSFRTRTSLLGCNALNSAKCFRAAGRRFVCPHHRRAQEPRESL